MSAVVYVSVLARYEPNWIALIYPRESIRDSIVTDERGGAKSFVGEKREDYSWMYEGVGHGWCLGTICFAREVTRGSETLDEKNRCLKAEGG